MKLLCKVIGHRRSRTWIARYGDARLSRCRFCSERMIRDGPGDWRLADDAELAAIRPPSMTADDAA